MARVVIATEDRTNARRISDLLVIDDITVAADPVSAATMLERGEQVVLLDAAASWAEELLTRLPSDRRATLLVIADPETLEHVPRLMRMGADWFMTLPTDRVVMTTAIESAVRARLSRQTDRSRIELTEKQLLRFAEDFRDAYKSEREKAEQLAESLDKLERSYGGTVRALAAAVESKDVTTGRHIERVTDMAMALTHVIDPELAKQPYLAYGFLLHDVGKIGVPDLILVKPGPLNEREFDAMRAHPEIGARIIEGIEFLEPVAPIVRHHHERWDGTGYPDGLAREQIPRGARIFSVADAADAMLHDRPYRRALPMEQVVERIRLGAGTQFDPDVVIAFTRLLESAPERSTSGATQSD